MRMRRLVLRMRLLENEALASHSSVEISSGNDADDESSSLTMSL
jgi:hypothetical protein